MARALAGHRVRRLLLPTGIVATILALLGGIAAVRMTNSSQDPKVLGSSTEAAKSSGPSTTGTGSCDVTGVHVGYTTQWAAAPAPGRFVVPTATVDSIQQPSCQGATLTVKLRDSATTTDLAVASAIVGTATAQTVSFASPPSAQAVNDVFVELSGGTTPVPPECEGMKLTSVIMGTTGDDTITDAKGGNLIYGLSGNDRITSGSQGDCIVGGDGTNEVVAGSGADVVKVGNGNGNVIDAGPGEDVIYLGNGNNNTVDGGNDKKNVCHVPYPVSQVAAHGNVIRNCTVVTP